MISVVFFLMILNDTVDTGKGRRAIGRQGCIRGLEQCPLWVITCTGLTNPTSTDAPPRNALEQTRLL